MLDAIKYTSLKLRKHQNLCIPKGPNFVRAKKEVVTLCSGSLSFRSPRHAPYKKHESGEKRLLKDKIYSVGDTSSFSPRWIPSDGWLETSVFARNWAFYGPWFTGLKGKVSCSISIVNLNGGEGKLNFLYPAALETAIQGYMTAYKGYEIYDEENLSAYYVAPKNWQPVSRLKIPAAVFDTLEVFTPGSSQRLVIFPVSSESLIIFKFSLWQYCSGSKKEKDLKVSAKPMQDLINNIIESIEFSPTLELQDEIDQLKSSCDGDYTVSSECQPFKWPADVDKDGLTILEYKKNRYERA